MLKINKSKRIFDRLWTDFCAEILGCDTEYVHVCRNNKCEKYISF